jgi:ATP-dependent Zn protease
MISSDRQHTAYHEAGHAVIARVLFGMPCGQVTIRPDFGEEVAGHAITANPNQVITYWRDVQHKLREMRSAMHACIMTLMAGAEAEIVILGRCHGGDNDDRLQIVLIVDEATDFSPEQFWDRYEPRMRRQTRRLVSHHRNKIERVANALVERETLQPDEVEALMA